jgi:uncharacterized membrane protein YeaQ/YmgE (transglycosylase-associated protein family)
MHLIGAIIIGFFAGLIAKLIMPGKDPGGFIMTTLIGIVGAVIATFLGRTLGWYGPGEGAGFLASIGGAIILLFLYRFIARPTGTGRRMGPTYSR